MFAVKGCGGNWRSRLALLLVTVMFTVLTPVASAHADASQMTTLLCTNTSFCSVNVSGNRIREGATAGVNVTGQPNVTVSIAIFQLEISGQKVVGMTKISDDYEVRISSHGQAFAYVPVPPVKVKGTGGWALVSLSDTVWEDPSEIVGSIVSLGARRPTILGDGFAVAKPVGVPISQHITNYIDTSQFSIEYLSDAGDWRDVTTGFRETDDEGQPVMIIDYQIPQGIQDKPYRFRLNNITDKSSGYQEWIVHPSRHALPQPRLQIFQPPNLEENIPNTVFVPVHHKKIVVGATSIIGGIFGLLAIGLPAVIIAKKRPKVAKK